MKENTGRCPASVSLYAGQNKRRALLHLSLFAIAKELAAVGSSAAFEQVDLAVGLPPEHFGCFEKSSPSTSGALVQSILSTMKSP